MNSRRIHPSTWRKRELPVLPVVRPPALNAMIKEERKAQEAKAISSIPSNFWQSLAAVADGISQKTSQPGDALGVTPISGAPRS